MFVDLADSTALAETLDPERMRSILQAYFSVVASTVQAWGGTVEKYIGDAVVALFGVPRVREDDAARALSAAAEIVTRVAELTGPVGARQVKLVVRVGVNTGEVIAPSEIRPDRPMVTGDAINVAARLQAHAEPGSVLVGERTFQATRTAYEFADPIELLVKGKSEPVVARRLLGPAVGPAAAGPSRTLQARVIGRDRELAVLAGLLDEAIESRTPRLAVIYGPAGIGKSRLGREAVSLASAERPDLVVLRGRCPASGPGATYWALAELVRAACGISLNDGLDLTDDKLRQRGSELLRAAGLPDADIEATIFAIATTAGIVLADNPLDSVRPNRVALELARRWPQFISALCARQPLMIVIEDLHWASEQLVEMVEHILTRSNGPCLLIATARPEFGEAHPGFASGRSEVGTVSLRPLSRTNSASLLGSLLPQRDLPRSIEDAVLDTAEGNPLFIEEIVTRLIEAGTLTQQGGTWQATPGAATAVIPDTIHGLLAARIDGLPEIERRVLREAAVVGRVFWDRPVAIALGSAAVAEPLNELERRGLISMRPTSSLADQVEYSFKHGLIRDVAYAGLSLARRARAHAAVAEWLATLREDRPDEMTGLIAFHYQAALSEGSDLAWPADSADLADVRRRAQAAFLAAGSLARRRFAIDRALELHRAALGLATTDEDRAIALDEIGEDHFGAYHGNPAVEAWDEAIALRRGLPGAGEHVARMCMKAARMGGIMWGSLVPPMEPDVIDRYVDTGLAGATDDGTRAWLHEIRTAAGNRWMAFHRSDPIPLLDRIRSGEEARRYAQQVGDGTLEAQALGSVAQLLISHGEVAAGLEDTRSQLAMAGRIEDPRERHLDTILPAITLTWLAGDAEAMVPPLREAIVVARDLAAHDVNHSTFALMSVLYLTGRWAEIPGYLDEHLRTFASNPDTSCFMALGGFPLGAAFLANRGEIDRARSVLELMPASEMPMGMVEGLQALAAVALGDPASGRAIAERILATGTRDFAQEAPVELAAMLDALVALEDWDALGEFLPELRPRADLLALAMPAADRAEGLMAAATGDREQARALLSRAVGGFDRLFGFEAARTREALAAIDPARGKSLLAAALETYERLGAKPHEARVRAMIEGQTG